MFDYDISTLEKFSFDSICDVFAIIAKNYQVKPNCDTEPFHYKSYYLSDEEVEESKENKKDKKKDKKNKKDNEDKETQVNCDIIPKSLIEKYQRMYAEEKISTNYTIDKIPYEILSRKYNHLLNEKKEFTKIEGYKKALMDQKVLKGELDMVKDVNFSNSYYPYASISELAPISLYRRLRTDPYEMSMSMMILIIEASDFPLKLTLAFEKGSIREKKYTPIFHGMDNIQEQLECYAALESLSLTRLAKNGLKFSKYAYLNLFTGIIKFKEFEAFAETIGAKIKISFTADVIEQYKTYQAATTKILNEVQKVTPSNINNRLKDQILKDILDTTPELEIVESLIQLEKNRYEKNRVGGISHS